MNAEGWLITHCMSFDVLEILDEQKRSPSLFYIFLETTSLFSGTPMITSQKVEGLEPRGLIEGYFNVCFHQWHLPMHGCEIQLQNLSGGTGRLQWKQILNLQHGFLRR